MKRLILIAVFIGVILLMPGCCDFSNTSENNNYPDTEDQVKQSLEEQIEKLEKEIEKYNSE